MDARCEEAIAQQRELTQQVTQLRQELTEKDRALQDKSIKAQALQDELKAISLEFAVVDSKCAEAEKERDDLVCITAISFFSFVVSYWRTEKAMQGDCD